MSCPPAPATVPAPPVSLVGKKVLIAGGTTGVGRAAARLMAEQGCRVFICGRDPERLSATVSEIQAAGGDVNGIAVDLNNTEGIVKFFAESDKWLKGLDIAILNTGIGSKGELVDMTHEEYREVISVNLLSIIGCSLESMKRLTGKGGHIIMTGSMSADVFDTRATVYVAAKCGIRGFARCLRKEANPKGVKVSVVEPGSIATDMVDETPEEQEKMIRECRMLRPEDIAEAMLYLIRQPEWCDVIELKLRPHQQLI